MMYDTWKNIEDGIAIASKSIQSLGALKYMIMEQRIDEPEATIQCESVVQQIKEAWDSLYKKTEDSKR